MAIHLPTKRMKRYRAPLLVSSGTIRLHPSSFKCSSSEETAVASISRVAHFDNVRQTTKHFFPVYLTKETKIYNLSLGLERIST